MNEAYVLIFIIGTILVLALFFNGFHIPKVYLNRKCMGKQWLKAFPNSSKAEIRNFLGLFSDSFLFSAKDQLKFEPNDKLYEIYRAIYPSEQAPDAMELETFATLLYKQYNFKLESIWSENITLGEVFAKIKNA
jgi:propanediol dehydratase small subunit